MLWCCVCASVCGQYMCVCDVSVMCVHVCGVYSCRLMLMSSAAFDNRCKSFNVYTYVCGPALQATSWASEHTLSAQCNPRLPAVRHEDHL